MRPFRLAAVLVACAAMSARADEPPPPIMELSPPAADAPAEDAAPTPPNPWANTPPARPFPRLGYSLFPPRGPGYYSLHDVLFGEYRPAPPRYPYPPFGLIPFTFFDADFRYLDDPKNTQHAWFDLLKRRKFADDNLMASFGGDLRWRTNYEVQTPRLNGRVNSYDLFRSRTYADFWYRDLVRVYGEFLYGDIFGTELTPLPSDVNRGELLNAFADVKLGEVRDRPVYLRVGQQELLYGSERLISPLDWTNVRRTFQGVKVFRPGDKFDLDAFWVQPVPVIPGRFDGPDDDRNFFGLWAQYRPRVNHFIDAYYLVLNQAKDVVVNRRPTADNFDVHTLGARVFGDEEGVMYDFETILQLGTRNGRRVLAGAVTATGGYRFADLDTAPQFWAGYDFASGDNDPRTGRTSGTFNQLFPFGHYYFGFLDAVGRQNIHDVSAQAAFYPLKWVVCLAQFHSFWLAEPKDGLFNAAGVLVRQDRTGGSGTHVGEELDLLTNLHLSPSSDLLLGYSVLFPGEFLERTARTPAQARTGEYFYAQYTFRY